MSTQIEHLEASEMMQKATETIDRLRAELDAERKAHAETRQCLELTRLECDRAKSILLSLGGQWVPVP